jgi:curli production assembly/transport component CsgG
MIIRKIIPLIALTAILGGCATGEGIKQALDAGEFQDPVVEQSKLLKKEKWDVPPPANGPIPVAVYQFMDKTGQRKSSASVASLSSAVTQGADAYLVKALQDIGGGRWFTVLERGGLDNLIKERQMIRQMRELYQGKEAKPLPPMMFAGIILEGGIVGYDSNTLTGGAGVRIFGIGATTQYQSDTVTVNLRSVSVATGEVLTSVTVTKSVLSYMDKVTLTQFISDGTQSVEGEIGGSINESINKATDLAVQAAVIDTIREGARKGHWAFKVPTNSVSTKPDEK